MSQLILVILPFGLVEPSRVSPVANAMLVAAHLLRKLPSVVAPVGLSACR